MSGYAVIEPRAPGAEPHRTSPGTSRPCQATTTLAPGGPATCAQVMIVSGATKKPLPWTAPVIRTRQRRS